MAFKNIKEARGVSVETFRNEIVPASEPVVLRGVATHWPAVAAAKASPQDFDAYLGRFDSGKTVESFIGAPEIEGRFFYDPEMRGVNFKPLRETLPEMRARLLAQIAEQAPPAIALQAAIIPELLPGFTDENALDLVPAITPPRMWFGNQVTVQTHYDPSENVAIVVAGRRRFTLFPPDQLNNLYIGPLEMTPAGVPVSLASIDAPDFNAHPRMAEALKCGQSAELEPGDGLFIPYHWLHHVASLERYNLLVNYWWSPSDPSYGAPRDALVHALIAVRTLPAHQRAAWRIMFEHYVFEADGEPAAHIPAHARGVLGAIEPVQARRVLKLLGGKLASS
jgi:hypothetical protein